MNTTHQTIASEDALLTPRDVAADWGLSVKTLANQRSKGEGPAYIRLGGAIRYRREDIAAYVERSRVVPALTARVAA